MLAHAARIVNNSAWTEPADELMCQSPMTSPARTNRILHIDGDSFFASYEIALDASLEGRPVWVGGSRRGDGIVIAANRLPFHAELFLRSCDSVE